MVVGEVVEGFEIECEKVVRKYGLVMGEGIWVEREKVSGNDCVRDVLKDGWVRMGFMGVGECVVVVRGKDEGERES